MPASTLQIMLDAVQDVPELVALINAVQASVVAHKGEDAVDTGLDIIVDVAPALKALYAKIAAQIKAATPPAAPGA